MTSISKNLFSHVFDTSANELTDYFGGEKPSPLAKDGDPLVCVMLSELSPDSIFKIERETDGGICADMFGYAYNADKISEKLQRGDELTDKAQAIFNLANEIREYYTARLVEEKLTNKERRDSKFATDLMKALNIRGSIQPEYTGIYHKLQDFYQSDIKWDNFVQTHKSVSDNHEFASVKSMTPSQIDLKFVDYMYSSSNKSFNNKISYCKYYFTDRHNYLYEFSVPSKNILRSFLEHYFQTSEPWKSVQISARRKACPVPYYRNDFNYFQIFGIR